jgi:hypothetical protein
MLYERPRNSQQERLKMRDILTRTGLTALAASLAFAVSACGGGNEAADEGANEVVDSNLLFEEPANDASALESVGNAVEPLPELNAGNEAAGNTVMGETEGGDTGGNTVESNVSGM